MGIESVTISQWHNILEGTKPVTDSEPHSWICKEDNNITVHTQAEIDASNGKISKISLSNIISISNQLVDEVSISPFEFNKLNIIVHPFSAFKKNYEVSLLSKKIPAIVESTVTMANLFSKSEDLLVTELKDQLRPLRDEGTHLQSIFMNVKKMVERSEEKKKDRVLTVWERLKNWFCSNICSTPLEKINTKLIQLEGPNIPTDIAILGLQTMTFQVIKQFDASLTLEEFTKRFIDGKESLLLWGCSKNNLGIQGLAKIQNIWEKLKKTLTSKPNS